MNKSFKTKQDQSSMSASPNASEGLRPVHFYQGWQAVFTPLFLIFLLRSYALGNGQWAQYALLACWVAMAIALTVQVGNWLNRTVFLSPSNPNADIGWQYPILSAVFAFSTQVLSRRLNHPPIETWLEEFGLNIGSFGANTLSALLIGLVITACVFGLNRLTDRPTRFALGLTVSFWIVFTLIVLAEMRGSIADHSL